MTKRWRKNGKRIRNAAGKRARAEECCCGEEGNCEYCLSGNSPESITVSVSGFVDDPWTTLNGNFILALDGFPEWPNTCSYYADGTGNPCGAWPGSYCLSVLIATGKIIVRFGGDFQLVPSNVFPLLYAHGGWRFEKSFGGPVVCTGVHSLSLTAAVRPNIGELYCTSWDSSTIEATEFRHCGYVLSGETPTCQVTF